MLETKFGGTGLEFEIGLIREILSLSPKSSELDVAAERCRYDAAEFEFPLRPDLGVSRLSLGNIPCELISRVPHSDSPTKRVIVYLHGGGYVLGSSRSHRHLAGAIAQVSGIPVLLPDYGLAPERPCPSGLEDCCRVVSDILEKWGSPEIALVGDSAGGGLAVAAAVCLRGRGEPIKAIVCLSPWLDLTCSRSIYAGHPADPSLKPARLRSFAASYLRGVDPHDPRASPLFAELHGLPPILAHVAKGEIFEEETQDFAFRVASFGGNVTVETWHNVVHVWHWYWPILGAGREAIANIGKFLSNHLGRNSLAE